jgi:signal transduction histidine kinase
MLMSQGEQINGTVPDRFRNEVLSIASHDLKTPATVIRLRAELLRRKLGAGTATPEELGAGLDTVMHQADRMVELLKLLLEFSCIEAGQLALERSQVDLVAVAGAAVEEIRPTTDRHRLVVREPAAVVGFWDELRLKEVLTNLLTNAVKYSPDGGAIEVTVAGDERTATVRVRDQGVGLGPEELPRVFERFYRAEGTRQLEGSGLGLHICQGIIAAHGGRIWSESEGTGRGSTFCFTIPRTTSGGQGEAGLAG